MQRILWQNQLCQINFLSFRLDKARRGDARSMGDATRRSRLVTAVRVSPYRHRTCAQLGPRRERARLAALRWPRVSASTTRSDRQPECVALISSRRWSAAAVSCRHWRTAAVSFQEWSTAVASCPTWLAVAAPYRLDKTTSAVRNRCRANYVAVLVAVGRQLLVEMLAKYATSFGVRQSVMQPRGCTQRHNSWSRSAPLWYRGGWRG